MSWLEKLGMSSKPASSQPSANNQQSALLQNNQQQQEGTSAPPADKPIDPLAVFGKMYDNTTNADVAPTFNLDDKQLTEVANTQNFATGVDKALLARATSGDSEALLEIINAVGRNSYKAALAHGSKLTDTFVNARDAHSMKALPGRIRGELVNNEFGNTPNFSNPTVRNQLRDTADRLQRQHPDASPQEIKKMSMNYITELANAINPPKPSKQTAGPKETNFDEWLDGNE